MAIDFINGGPIAALGGGVVVGGGGGGGGGGGIVASIEEIPRSTTRSQTEGQPYLVTRRMRDWAEGHGNVGRRVGLSDGDAGACGGETYFGGSDSQIWPKLSSNPSFSIFINCNDQMIMLYWINLPTSGSHWCGCATAAGIQP